MTRPRRLTARTEGRVAAVDVRPDGSVLVHEVGADPEERAAREVTVSYLGHGRVSVNEGPRAALAHVVDDGETRWVFVHGHVFEVEVEDQAARTRRRPATMGHESLSAPMPATVVRIAVTVGQAVTRGATLVILEAMKMELPLRAPHDAIVEGIHCAEGELVQPGTPLVDLDERRAAP